MYVRVYIFVCVRCVWLTTSHPRSAERQENPGPLPTRNPSGHLGLLRDDLYLYIRMYMFMYICMCVCLYVRTYIYIYICLYVCIHACIYVCICIYMLVWIYDMYVWVYVYIRVYVFLFVMCLTVANKGKLMVPISPAFASTGLLARMIIVLSMCLICEVFSYHFVSYAAFNMSPLWKKP